MGIISTDELREIINSKRDYVLIDVRTKNELNYGMIPNAVHLCLDDFEKAFSLNEKDFFSKYNFKKPAKSELIVVYCRTGNRSGAAAEYLESKKYNVRNYKGSVQAWSLIDENVRMY